MLITKRYGIRADGNPVVEETTYVPTTADHPAAVQIDGEEGYWVRLAVGNSLTSVAAREVSKIEHDQAKVDLEALVAEKEVEREMARERRQAEIEAKRDGVTKELRKLGLTEGTIAAILQRVEEE